jgi:hypothetical protein
VSAEVNFEPVEEEQVPELVIARIRTSDRSTFKRCRRKWGWHSGIKQNLQIKDTPSYFWIGTGGHFAMEDWYGYNYFGHPVEAFNAYVTACKEFMHEHKHGLPDDWEEQQELGQGILEHYLYWIDGREKHKTVWIDGAPMVEVKCEIDLPIKPPEGFDKVVYQLTLDRLVEIDGEYWITDYKFYKQFGQGDLAFDAQMSAYIWGAQTIFEKPIAGAILHELVKKLPNEPRILKSGDISTAQNQGTTHRLYRRALIEQYGSIDDSPGKAVECLNDLAHQETEDRDNFIRRTKTRRNEMQMQAMGSMILLEAHDMCNPDLPLYPNMTRDCSWDCQLKDICLMIDRDDDWESLLLDLTVEQTEENISWRDHLVLPKQSQQ